MRWQIHAPSRALVPQALCIFSGILFGVQISSCYMTSSIYHRTDNARLTDYYANLSKVTAIACCSRCHSDSSCKSVTYHPGSQECRLSSITFTKPFASNIEPNDEWATYSDTYQPRDCSDIDRTGDFSSGVFEIFPVGVQVPVKVFCDFDHLDGPWTVIQKNDGTLDSHRNYTEYQVGFGNLAANFWLGLDKISSLSLKNGKQYCLKIIIIYSSEKSESVAEYSRFQVMNATTGYRLHVGGYSGTAGDGLSDQCGQPFSTYDRDMDSSDGLNCAQVVSSGWWFKRSCYRSNLNGIYGPEFTGGMRWFNAEAYDTRTCRFSLMKIKKCTYTQ